MEKNAKIVVIATSVVIVGSATLFAVKSRKFAELAKRLKEQADAQNA